jgi:hypothetical protein
MSIIKTDKYYLTSSALSWLSNLLSNWLGIDIYVKEFDDYSYQLYIKKYETSIIIDNLVKNFANPHGNIDFTYWDPKSEGFDSILNEPIPSPGYSEINLPIIEIHNDLLYLHYDLIGLIYWSLVRIEEYKVTKLDEHNRFQQILSHAGRYNYLDRPFIDEWIHILKQLIKYKSPNVEFKKNNFKIILSHDVDRPFFYLYLSFLSLIRITIADILKRRSISTAIKRYKIWIEIRKLGHYHKDPYFTFDFIMTESEKRGINSFFYFMTSSENKKFDAEYKIENKEIIELIKEINKRGHNIGIHPSYNSYLNQNLIGKELSILQKTLLENGINNPFIDCRMHYLRYDISKTPISLYLNGINRDSSLNYANESGFRCGTCFDYEMFDHISQKSLNLIQMPLIVMDNNFLPINCNINFQDKIENIKKIKERCKKLNGNFTILWHNSELYNLQLKNLFLSLIS